MKRISTYVITYNNEERLNENIYKFFETTKKINNKEFDIIFNVINNHTTFNIHKEFENKINIMHNLRPEFSCGHLSRDYNTALIHGFHNLNNPYSDQVICAHDDSLWETGWFETLVEIHKKYTFYAGDYGCSMTSYLPDAIKKIGIWDERFCNIGYHEADYFLRALLYNKNNSSINDYFGGRVLNPTKVIFSHPPPNTAKNIHSSASLIYHTVSRKVFADKWNVHPEMWESRLPPIEFLKPLIDTYMYYPYFELDIENLEEKRYSYAKKGLEHFLPEWR